MARCGVEPLSVFRRLFSEAGIPSVVPHLSRFAAVAFVPTKVLRLFVCGAPGSRTPFRWRCSNDDADVLCGKETMRYSGIFSQHSRYREQVIILGFHRECSEAFNPITPSTLPHASLANTGRRRRSAHLHYRHTLVP